MSLSVFRNADRFGASLRELGAFLEWSTGLLESFPLTFTFSLILLVPRRWDSPSMSLFEPSFFFFFFFFFLHP